MTRALTGMSTDPVIRNSIAKVARPMIASAYSSLAALTIGPVPMWLNATERANRATT